MENITFDNIRTVYYNLPNTIKGFTVSTNDDFFTIILNQNLSHMQNMETYYHELKHIQNGDFSKNCSAGLLEIVAHNN